MMKAGPKSYLFFGIVSAFIFLANLMELSSGQGDWVDVLEAIFFPILSTYGFVSYFRVKRKT